MVIKNIEFEYTPDTLYKKITDEQKLVADAVSKEKISLGNEDLFPVKEVLISRASNSYFQIGPYAYSGEVQDIQIVENKALQVMFSTRGAGDYLVDGGPGDCNIVATLIFSGRDSVENRLLPLISLFRMSPITSIKNEMVENVGAPRFSEAPFEDSPINEYVDNYIESYKRISNSYKFAQNFYNNFVNESVQTKDTIPSEEEYNSLKEKYPQNTAFTTYKTYEDLEKGYSDAGDIDDERRKKDSSTKEGTAVVNGLPFLSNDSLGFVPVAFVDINVQTHPELANSLIARLIFKRIESSSLGEQRLQYYKANGSPTFDPKDAYWLKRGLDIYSEKYLKPEWIFKNNESDFNEDVSLRFEDSDQILDFFIKSNGLGRVSLNKTNSEAHFIDKGISLTQMSIGYTNKFAFPRLAGKSYPTAQFMSSSSGSLSVSFRTSSEEDFIKFHTYKSAADFFARTADKNDRYKGWIVDSFITKLFATKLRIHNNNVDYVTRVSKNSWFPTQIVSKTNSESPSLKDVSIIFQENNLDFFQNHSVTIKREGLLLENLWKFFNYIYNDAVNRGYSNKLSWPFKTVFSDGNDISNKFSIVNSDSLVGSFFQKKIYNEATNKFKRDISPATLALYKSIAEKGVSEITSDEEDSYRDFSAAFGLFGDIKINEEAANSIFNTYFEKMGEDNDNRTKELLRLIPEAKNRRALYERVVKGKAALNEKGRLALFSAIVQRDSTSVSSRLYNLSGLVDAYDTLAIAKESRPDLEETLAYKKLPPSTEVSAYLTPDKPNVPRIPSTAYPDYPIISYDELFETKDQEKNKYLWREYAPTYQDLGLINDDIQIYGGVKGYEFHESNADAASVQVAVSSTSPISPSVFFYRKRNLESLRDDVSKSSKELQESLNKNILRVPFDVLGTKFDSNGMSEGLEKTKDGQAQYSEIINRQIEYINSNDFRRDNAIDSIRELIAKYANSEKEANDLFLELANSEGDNSKVPFIEDAVVPLMLGSHMKSDVARHVKLTSLVGERGAKRLIQGILGDEFTSEFFAETVVRSAAGVQNMPVSCVNLEENTAAITKITQSVADQLKSADKAFPTMRLYIIDDSGPDILMHDALYGYHSIISIDITHDKNDPSLAVIRVADPLHILQGAIFNNEYSDSYFTNRGIVLPSTELDPGGRNFLERFKLQQGRSIQIRGGYNSDPEKLDVLFTGKIAELEFGDVVTIAAQGWKAELFSRQVNFQLNSRQNSSVKDLVVETVRQANPAGIGKVFTGEEKDKIVALSSVYGNLNRQVNASISANSGTLGAPTSSAARGNYGFGIGGERFNSSISSSFFSSVNKQGLDLRLKNIWVPDNDRTKWNYFADITDTGWEGDQWTVPVQTAWETLQQATNYAWNYICQVVPYETESTLFFGRPDQLYFYKDDIFDKKKKTQKKKYIETVKSYNDKIDQILESFRNSEEGKEWIRIENFDEFRNRNRLKKSESRSDLLSNSLNQYEYLKEELGESLAITLLYRGFYGFSNDFINNGLSPARDIEVISKTANAKVVSATLKSYYDVDFPYNTPIVGRNEDSYSRFQEILAILKTNEAVSFNTPTRFSIYRTDGVYIIRGGGKKIFAEVLRFDSQAVEADVLEIIGKTIGASYSERNVGRADSKLTIKKDGILKEERKFYEIVDSFWNNLETEDRQIFIEGKDFFPLVDSIREEILNRLLINRSSLGDNFANYYDYSFYPKRFYGRGETSFSAIDEYLKSIYRFRNFIFFITEHLRKLKSSNQEEADILNVLKESKSVINHAELHSMKVFKDYHYIDSDTDIIENNIAASTREMANTVLLRYPKDLKTNNSQSLDGFAGGDEDNYNYTEITSETEWANFPSETYNEDGQIGMQFNPEVTLKDKKIAVYTDLNCSREDQCAKVATSILTKAMRPMYRNNILITGRRIKPWDTVQINDRFNEMTGPVEVERVVHHYSAETGWVTNLIPHAICQANSQNSFVQTAIQINKFNKAFNIVDTVLNALLITSIIPFFGQAVSGAALVARSASGTAAKALLKRKLKSVASKEARKGIVDTISGKALVRLAKQRGRKAAMAEGKELLAKAFLDTSPSMFASIFANQGIGQGADLLHDMLVLNQGIVGNKMPVTFTPLMHKGHPLVAGLAGDKLEFYSADVQLKYWWQDLTEAGREFLDSVYAVFEEEETSLNSIGLDGISEQE